MQSKRPYRQGDVLIIPIGDIESDKPDGMVKVDRENGRVVLAHGEVTGHCHAIDSPSASLYGIPNAPVDSDHELWLSESATLVHDEHEPIVLEAGRYTIRRQREYTPEKIVRVAD